jgi:ornithine cyclodeaminase/alanine dehydrogenase
MLLLNAEAVIEATSMAALVDAVEAGCREEFAGTVVLPPRLNLPSGRGFFRIMPAVLNGSGWMGFKAFHGSIKDGVRYLIAIYDQKSGELLAQMDAHYLTAARTGATTGVAAKYMAPKDARTVGVIGSGLEARTNLAGICAVRPIRHVRVFSPSADRRAAFAREVSASLDVEVEPADDPAACVRDRDIVVVATNTSGRPDPIAYRGAWAQAGQHIASIGSTMPVLREIDAETFGRAGLVISDSVVQLVEESGDAIDAVKQGLCDPGTFRLLKDVVGGAVSGRDSAEQITLFKSVGTAVQDVTAGFAVYREALRCGLGQQVDDFLELKLF